MDQLSSCYFCGDALDASIEEHPVVPESLDPPADAQRTVVLCPTCKRKLDAVLDSVVAAVDGNGEATPDDGADAPGPEVGDIESTLGDDEDVLRPVGGDADADPDEEPGTGDGDEDASDGERDDENGSDGQRDRKYTSARRAGYTGEGRSGSSGTVGRSGGSDGDSGDDGRGADDGGGRTAAGETDETDDGGRSGTDADGNSGSRGESDGDGGDAGGEGSEDGGDAGGDGPDVSLTRLENTKVMRLLRNREFPVEREDFVTVASSAYEVSPRDCEKVVDLAVEHDLLREKEGRLYAGSRWD